MTAYMPEVTFGGNTSSHHALVRIDIFVDGKKVGELRQRDSNGYGYYWAYFNEGESSKQISYTAHQKLVKAHSLDDAKRIIQKSLEGE